MLINNLITLLSTIFLGYYKVNEIIYDYRNKKNTNYLELENQNNNNNNNEDDDEITLSL
jgi:hypothetical protein